MGDNLINLILGFIFYSFLGWMIETVFKSIRDRRIINSGFLAGPFCPLYGFAALLIIQSGPAVQHLFPRLSPFGRLAAEILTAIVLVSALEYAAGALLEKLFHGRWWDYSDERFNIKGRVCVKYSIFWGALAYGLLTFVHPLYLHGADLLPVGARYLLTGIIVVWLGYDLVKSSNEAWDLRDHMAFLPPLSLDKHLYKYKRLLTAFPQLRFHNSARLSALRDNFKSSIDNINNVVEYKGFIDDLLRHDSVQMMKLFRHHCATSCYEHSIRVSFYSYLICRILGWDCRSAARGGMLHDLFLYDWRSFSPPEGKHAFVHSRIAMNNAAAVCSLNNIEEDIVLKHMFPLTWRPPVYKESFIVCLVDKYCTLAEILASLPGLRTIPGRRTRLHMDEASF